MQFNTHVSFFKGANLKKKIVILLCLISLSVFSGCGSVFEPDKVPPTGLQAYNKPGATLEEVKQTLKQCGYKVLNYDLPLETFINEYLKVSFCMTDKGFKIDPSNAPRESCIQTYNYQRFKPPVCVARGVFN